MQLYLFLFISDEKIGIEYLFSQTGQVLGDPESEAEDEDDAESDAIDLQTITLEDEVTVSLTTNYMLTKCFAFFPFSTR